MEPDGQKKWVEVVFPHPPNKRFTYGVPQRFCRDLRLGHRILVPLGSRKRTGFVVGFVNRPDIQEIKNIEDIMDSIVLLTPELLKLTLWVSDYYLCSWGEVIRTALPPGIHQKSRLIIQSIEKSSPTKNSLTPIEQSIMDLVQAKGNISLQILEKRLNRKNIRFHLGKLEKRGLILLKEELEEPRVKIKSEKRVVLNSQIKPDDLEDLKRTAPKQAYVVTSLMNTGGEVSRKNLDVDFSILRKLESKGLIRIWESETLREYNPSIKGESPKPITLTKEQAHSLSLIYKEIQKGSFNTFLLHGVTASGKTQVYIEAIRTVLDLGKTALVLIPEISLTPQAVQRYRGVFGNKVAVLHSRMSFGERYDSWRKIRDGKFRIGLGPRSAVFAPLENLGLIVVDEEHDTSYKQLDPAPRYHARDVAVVRGKLNHCPVILGSATPSLESFSNSLQKKYTLCQLTKRIDDTPMPKITLVDHTEMIKTKENRVISPLLREKIKQCLSAGEQIIILQNRRGYSTFLRCKDCGAIEGCPNCDITLTYHRKDRRVRCHYCGYEKPAFDTCPTCGGATFSYSGIGTQRVEEEVRKLFPDARLFRMDYDTTRRKGSHDRIVLEFAKGSGDILLGTQMVAKGHDFPGVSLVGIISADTGLHFPDFRAGEKTFQLLIQAAGRAGRRNFRGEVIIQTLSIDHPVLQFTVDQNYSVFYKWENDQRKELNYPPWGKIIIVRFKGPRQEKVARVAQIFADSLKEDPSLQCLGPASSPLSRAKRLYRFQVILRTSKKQDPTGKHLRDRTKKALVQFQKTTPLSGVRIGVDIDPVDMM
jgi:primosomal protein N' (replication factor Y)